MAERLEMENCPPVVTIDEGRVFLASRVFKELQGGRFRVNFGGKETKI